MAKDPLTARQRELLRQLREISEIIGVDYWNIRDRERVARTPVLEVIRRELIRGEVVSEYALIDELLAMKLCEYFFPRKGFIQLWKTQRFKRFNYYVLERLYLVQKLTLVKDVYRVPKTISGTIEEINALRNAVAHAFFPENLRAYRGEKRQPALRGQPSVLFRGKDIFTPTGIRRFVEASGEVYEFLVWRIKRKKKSPANLGGPVSSGVPSSV